MSRVGLGGKYAGEWHWLLVGWGVGGGRGRCIEVWVHCCFIPAAVRVRWPCRVGGTKVASRSVLWVLGRCVVILTAVIAGRLSEAEGSEAASHRHTPVL